MVKEAGGDALQDVVHPHAVPDAISVVLIGQPPQRGILGKGFSGGRDWRGGVVLGVVKGQQPPVCAASVLPDLANAGFVARLRSPP